MKDNEGIRGLANSGIETSMDAQANLIDFEDHRAKRTELEQTDDILRDTSKTIVVDLKSYFEKARKAAEINNVKELWKEIDENMDTLGNVLRKQTEIDAKDDYLAAKELSHIKRASMFLSRTAKTLGKIMLWTTRHGKKSVAI